MRIAEKLLNGILQSASSNRFKVAEIFTRTNHVRLLLHSKVRILHSFAMSQGEEEKKKPFKRLPTSVVPSNYEIKLQPNLQDFKFKGSQIVDLEVRNFS